MRAIQGQFSDARPIQRSTAEKRKLLAELKGTLTTMKPHTSPALRVSIKARIVELEAELAGNPGR